MRRSYSGGVGWKKREAGRQAEPDVGKGPVAPLGGVDERSHRGTTAGEAIVKGADPPAPSTTAAADDDAREPSPPLGGSEPPWEGRWREEAGWLDANPLGSTLLLMRGVGGGGGEEGGEEGGGGGEEDERDVDFPTEREVYMRLHVSDKEKIYRVLIQRIIY